MKDLNQIDIWFVKVFASLGLSVCCSVVAGVLWHLATGLPIPQQLLAMLIGVGFVISMVHFWRL